MGHLKAGVTREQAIADLNSIGAVLEKSYPKDDNDMSFTLARPSLYGDYLDKPVRAFMTGLMLLAGLILLAACANLGSLFAARAADRSREVALRLALGAGPTRILRQLFTEAVLISMIGGVAGLWGSVVLLHWLSAWQPFPQYPLNMPVNPDANVYGVALLLSLASGFLFGAAPVKQVLRADPYQIIKSGSTVAAGRWFTVRDLLLAVQIAICAVLVTSSMVAVRGLVRSLHSNFGFEPQNVMLVDTDLNMAGYSGDGVPAMQRRMVDAMASIPGVTSVGLVSDPPLHAACCAESNVFTDKTTDLKPSNAAATAIRFSISPEYLRAAGTPVLAGRNLTSHDDKNAPRVAMVNRMFASRIFGSTANALDRYYKMDDAARIQVVGIVEDGKYSPNITEEPSPAMFLPILQSPSTEAWLVVRSSGNPQQLGSRKDQTAGPGLRVAVVYPNLERSNGRSSVSFTDGGGVAGYSGSDGRDVVHNWHLWNGGVFGQQAAEGIGNSYGPRRTAQGSVTGSVGTCIQIAGLRFRSGIAPRNSGKPGSGFHRVSGNSTRSAGIGWYCSSVVVAG